MLKRKCLWFTLVFLVISLLLQITLACGTKNIVNTQPTQVVENRQESLEERINKALPFCEEKERIVLEFKSIDTAYAAISRHSIFRSRAEDPNLLSKDMAERIFQFLSHPTPLWAERLLKEEQAAQAFRPARLSKRFYEELLQEPLYRDLQGTAGKNSYIEASINALIKATKDPFAYYFSPEQWAASGGMQQHQGTYVGMGLTLSKNERGDMVVYSVSKRKPAQKAGLEVGDVLLLANGKRIDSCSATQFVGKIKTSGEKSISLVLRKNRTNELKETAVLFEEIQLAGLSTCPSFNLPEGREETGKSLQYVCPIISNNGTPREDILYIDLKTFSTQAAQDLGFILSTADYSKISGIIIDVRGNLGGLLNSASDILDYFLLTEDVIFQEEMTSWNPFWGNTTTWKSLYRQNKYNLIPVDIPVVVLVDSSSYSAAEVFAGAMQDYKRAALISKDERTGGKGTVSWYFELAQNGMPNQGALQVSIGFWKTPNGQSIQKQDLDQDGFEEIGGLRPDVRVQFSDEDYVRVEAEKSWYDPVIFSAIEIIDLRNGK